MISFVGNLILWLCLLFSIFQFIGFNKNNTYISKFKVYSVFGLFITSTISFLLLMYAHVISDFSLINVFQNSHTTKPLIYKISGVWGNHEGSMLLWILVLCVFNLFIYNFYNKKNSIFISKTLETQAIIIFGFVLFTIITSNPFQSLQNIPKNGMGFNPVLQDPALAIHPPLLYFGYVGLSAVFSLSIATLCTNNNKIPWHIYMKPFVVAAWTFLTIGIAFGSIWAYYELGWGGWWFWDPVENASFMPWLLATALLHSLIVVDKKKSLELWVLLLAIISFLLSVLGTFLVRSGVLTSVHAFALDPTRGIYILIFASILGIYSLSLFGIKSKNFKNDNYISFLSKEGSILINNLLMIIVCASVFLGTIYPLLVETFTNNKISVGEPYFNSTIIPVIVPALLIMGIGPILSWNKMNVSKVYKEIIPSVILTLLITITFFLIYKSYSHLGLLGILLASWIVSNNFILMFKKTKKFSKGMITAHLGIGLLVLGITGSSVWQEEKIIQMKIGSETKIKNYKVLFNKIDEIKGSNYIAIQGNFVVKDNKKKIITYLKPENRYYPITNNFTTEASIHTNLLRDLYIVLGEGNIEKGWIVRIYNNPLVIWIWIGSLFIFIGGLISLKLNLKLLSKINL